jgi:LacI family transcriptional regulator
MPKDKRDSFRIALMLKAKGAYGRDIIAGVCDYVRSTRLVWDLLLDEDFRSRPQTIRAWSGDGVIADFDDPELVALLGDGRLPVVGVGSSFQNESDYPPGIPYVATDNAGLVGLAYDHLIDMGLQRFALYSMPPTASNRWAQQRETIFRQRVEADGMAPEVFNGLPTFALDWEPMLDHLLAWLRALPKPIGIIAVTDSRARQILQACIMDGIAVPEQVAIVGIDDDPLLHMLTRIPISSVAQGTRKMGRVAASMLHRRLTGAPLQKLRVLIPPDGINAQASTHHQPIYDRYVMRARHYIRQFAAQGLKVAQVADYVGVSRTTLESHFRSQFGYTVHDEILAFKLQLARELLETGELSCAEVAQNSGFTTVQYMYAVFRRELACSPLEYRAQREGDESRRESAAVAL